MRISNTSNCVRIRKRGILIRSNCVLSVYLGDAIQTDQNFYYFFHSFHGFSYSPIAFHIEYTADRNGVSLDTHTHTHTLEGIGTRLFWPLNVPSRTHVYVSLSSHGVRNAINELDRESSKEIASNRSFWRAHVTHGSLTRNQVCIYNIYIFKFIYLFIILYASCFTQSYVKRGA